MLAPAPVAYLYDNAPQLPEGDPVDPRELVGSGTAPIELEIGPGRGWFLFERLEAAPRVCLIGLEVRRKWAQIVDQRLASRGHGARARVFAEDARLAVRRFPDACVAVVFVHFPDPWWKKRHQKRLVVTTELGNEAARILVPGGQLFVQTDVAERAEAYQEALGAVSGLEPAGDEGPRIGENPFEARSPRERRCIEDGLPIHRLLYRRTSSSP